MIGWDNLPINPPGGHHTKGDVMLDNVDILNWTNDAGDFEFQPRLRDSVQMVSRLRPALAGDAPELDEEVLFDCD